MAFIVVMVMVVVLTGGTRAVGKVFVGSKMMVVS